MTQITEIRVAWTNDPGYEGWSYWAANEDGLVASGGVDADDLDEAIDEAVRMLGVDVRTDSFAREPHDGGFAVWVSNEAAQ